MDAAGNASYKVYDRANRLKYEIDANDYVTQRDYDAFGNVEVLTRYANPVTFAPADISQGVSLAEVQAALNPDAANDRVLITEYNKLGRATQVEQGAVKFFTGIGPDTVTN